MEFQVIWKMFPVFMLALWVLASFKFSFISRGQVNAWLGITALTLQSNLFYYGYIIHANIISTVIILGMMYRSMHPTEKALQESILFRTCMYLKKRFGRSRS